jgi:hypothetical protein
MKSVGNKMFWPGDLNFLLTGKSHWADHAGKRTLITWELLKHSSKFFPFYFYECKMNGFDQTSFGYSADKVETAAIQKAFAEAWERIWLIHLNKSDPKFSEILNSNGFAAGKTEAMAIKKAKEELIERAVLIEAWQQQRGWNKINIKSFSNKLLAIGLYLKGWKTFIFEINSNAGTVSTCFILHKKFGAIFDSCFKAEDAEEKLLTSVIKNSFFQKAENYPDLPEKGSPESHRQFYSNPVNLKAFDFLMSNKSKIDSIYLQDLDKLFASLIVSADVFPAVAKAYNNSWAELSWGKQSIKGKNPWPHPLA